ncbi:LytTR family DNA-binding domain-containing protein [Sphingomonas sp. AOB5]|uniref:LytTR family DNA-binding domain-containing protein n=1 Tax=Sphingomonas sp. AOB5 TaxID=3034017 RepID=UPI0023F8345B|nr:LytTR family DNA-binding domain-containing protein [Sphingomonas sp. AOB5]MDF7776332.1 LytTR family DNA-binding domain-containing protein [Sphingomonas sp. AOB5]
MLSARKLIVDSAAMAAIGVLVALLGPFGTFALPFELRLVYWLALGFAGYFLYMPACRWATRLAPRLDLPEPALWIPACLIATLPMSVVVWLVNSLGGTLRWPSPGVAVVHYFNVLVMGAIVCAVFWITQRSRAAARPPADPPEPASLPEPPAPRPLFLDRLPPHLGRDLIALEMEDHYVRAHTSLGSALILMRIRDAVAELEGIEGAQVHRSWWVARSAVVRDRRDGRSYRLVLTNDTEAPVARDRVAELREAGWLGS